jgi:hypothetical protein
MKCIECGNETETYCSKCPPEATPLCVDREAYQNTCSRDHATKAHAPSSTKRGPSELSMFVQALRGEITDLRRVLALEEQRSRDYRVRFDDLTRWLKAAHPEIHGEAVKAGVAQ